MELYNKLKKPPKEALKPILAGRLKGKTDINPQWRIQALTEQFGICGIGWKYVITKQWTEPACNSQVFAFMNIDLYIKVDNEWSEPIPGTGGTLLIVNEKNGAYSDDEAYKKSLTDALGVAMKSLGMAADVYMGLMDNGGNTGNDNTDSKYQNQKQQETKPIDERKWLNKWVDKEHKKESPNYWNVVNNARAKGMTIEDLKTYYKISQEIEKELKIDM